MTSTNVAAHAPSGMRLWNRELSAYPEHATRRLYLLLVVLITVALYYELYVGGGVATLMLPELKIPFPVFVYVLAGGNLLGAFASLLAGLADRFGRANLVVYGLLLVGLITLFWMPNVKTHARMGDRHQRGGLCRGDRPGGDAGADPGFLAASGARDRDGLLDRRPGARQSGG